MDILATHHCKNDFRGFWKHTNRLNAKPSLPVSINGMSEPNKISNLFVDHFFIKSPCGLSKSMLNAETNMEMRIRFESKNIAQTIKCMTRGKSAGHDGLSIEHL